VPVAFTPLGDGMFSCELVETTLEIYRDDLGVYHIGGQEAAGIEIDIRNGEITVYELEQFAEAWTGERLAPLDAAMFAAGDGTLLTAEQFDRLIAGGAVEGFELLAITERPGPDSTFNDLTGGADMLARTIVIWGHRFDQFRFIVACTLSDTTHEWTCKAISIVNLAGLGWTA